MVALRAAGQRLQNYRLPGTTLYVTLEPCPMCAGALVHARVARLVYGAADPRAGAAGSVMNLVQSSALNHRMEVTGGVLAERCGQVLTEFFRRRR
jgi:tRNA(adenine34) deaminase